MKPKVCILKTDGTNCDQETLYAFQQAGGNAEIVLLTDMRAKKRTLREFDILALPGGFSYGDDIASGRVFSIELLTFLKDQMLEFVDQKKPIIGICNGFQILVRTGLLPFAQLGTISATLTDNSSGTFVCKTVEVAADASACIFTKGLEGQSFGLPIAHAEGRFIAAPETLNILEKKNLIALRYTHDNPNGSDKNIAGICDASGTIFGLMPHPERIHSNVFGQAFFNNAIEYVR